MRMKYYKVLVVFTVGNSIVIVPKNSGLREYRNIALSCLETKDAKVIEARGEDIPFLVSQLQEKGKKAIGLTGQDLYKEFCLRNKDSKIRVLRNIKWDDKNAMFGKPVLCLIGPKGRKIQDLRKNLTVFISAKYKGIAKKYLNFLEQKGFNFKKRYINGCVETSCSEGIADLIIDIVYTGSSLIKYDLDIYDKIIESDFVIISNNVRVRNRVEDIEEYKAPLEGRRDKLRLDFNENTIGCSEKVIEVLNSFSRENVAMYPEYGEFKGKLARYLEVSKKDIILTNGTDEAIKLIMDYYAEKGDEIVIPEPTFALFKFYSKIAGAKVVGIRYNEDLSFPVDKVLSSISDKTKIVVIVTPNNPTGTVVDKEDIILIVKKARKNNTIVLIDEAYWQFYGKSCRDLIFKYDNVVVIQTFSKAFGLAGLRLGYIISNVEMIKEISKVCSPYSVNSVAVACARVALDDIGYVDNYVKEIIRNREYLRDELERIGIKTYETRANFVIAKFNSKCNQVFEQLRDKDILVRDKSDDIEGCLRITVGTKEQCEKILDVLKQVMKERVILFDMDGVLVDTTNSYDNAICNTVEFFSGKRIDCKIINDWRIKGFNNDWDLTEAILLENRIRIQKDKVIAKFQEFYSKFSISEKLLISKRLLNKWSKEYVLGIVTGRPRKEAEEALRRFGISEIFDVVVTMDDCEGRLKPSPYGIELALEKLGKKDAIYFGDNLDDIKAGVKAGIKVFGISRDDKIRRVMKDNGATKILEDVDAIIGAI
jgi:histidinol-phosphate aminotransferase